MTFVGLQVVGQLALVAQTHVVEPRETGYPVAVLQLAVALQVVLSAGEVPHEVAPIHEVALVREEEPEVFHLCGHLHADILAATVVGNGLAFNTAHPAFVGLGVLRTVHAGEKHVLGVLVVVLGANDEVGVLLVFGGLLLALVYRSALAHHRTAHFALSVQGDL